VRARLFWKLGLTYLALLAGVLFAVNFYSSRVLRSDYVRATNDKLASLSALALHRPPRLDDSSDVQAWMAWLSTTGVRVTLIDHTNTVIADSSFDSSHTENVSNGPEISQAFATGEGESVRRSELFGQEFIHHAVIYRPPLGSPVVIRLSLPLAQIDTSLSQLRRSLSWALLAILLLGGLFSLLYFRSFAARVERLKEFSHRLAGGNFQPLPAETARDELSELADSLNETALWMDKTIRSLSGERNRSNTILRSMVEGVAVIDAQQRVVFSNRAFSEILNLDPVAIEGRPVIEAVRNSDLVNLIRGALRGEEGLRSDIATGIVQLRSFSVSAAPIPALEENPAASSAGITGATMPGIPDAPLPARPKVAGAVVVLHDVTEVRRLERVRQDFVANVSHEFKTPLTAIQGFAETLLAGALDDPANNRRFLEIIREHAARLARLTDDLLKLARIEAGKLEVEFFQVGVMELIEGCAETALLKAVRKQIALEIDVPPELPAMRGDASLLREVLQNLLDNALQYTPAGGHIRVSAVAAPREIVIAVADTGIGIPLADQERIFERFYRVDAARSREAGGTGLGLSIAKHIVEVHGGRLWVESEVGAGSKFSFSVPLDD
jgi:two-component system, OmpR family, phosphate regulon sensor histidine kinase PhoR